MKPMASIPKKLFEGIFLNHAEQELLELTKLDENTLYARMGVAGRLTQETLETKSEYVNCPNMGDPEGKSPFFFRHEKVELSSPAIYCNLPDNDLEAGRIILNQMGVHFDRVICDTVSKSPLFGYRQEAIKLGTHCIEAVTKAFPMIDEKIIWPFVALRAKQMFNICAK